jgi:hypothetical protein
MVSLRILSRRNDFEIRFLIIKPVVIQMVDEHSRRKFVLAVQLREGAVHGTAGAADYRGCCALRSSVRGVLQRSSCRRLAATRSLRHQRARTYLKIAAVNSGFRQRIDKMITRRELGHRRGEVVDFSRFPLIDREGGCAI